MFAAIREKLSSRKRRPSGTSHPTRSRRLGIEALEERALLAASPIVFATMHEGQFDVGNTLVSARLATVAPMMETQVQGKLSSGADVDIFRVSLKQGQILTADVDPPFTFTKLGTTGAPRLSLLNSAGSTLAANTAQAGQSLEYRVPQTGTYYVKVANSAPTSTTAVSYNLDLRPIGLNNAIDVSYLGEPGGAMYAFLDGTTQPDGTKVLDIAGPVGHGFGVRGNWTQTVTFTNGLPGATYKANGIVHLQTPNGEVPMALPTGGITLSTKAQQWGGDFGEVGSLDWNAPENMAAYQAILGAIFPASLLGLATINESTKIGIGLGRDTIVQNTGAPVNAAVPYLYFSVNPLMDYSWGGATQVFSAVADPADPFLYIGSPMTSGYFPITGLAASQQGLIPFKPNTTPSQYDDTLRGHLYVSATINTTALTKVPSQIDGELVLNVDPNHTGQVFGGVFSTTELVSLFVNPVVAGPVIAATLDSEDAHTLLTNLSVGINGELNISPFDKFVDGWWPASNSDYAGNGVATESLLEYVLDQNVPRILTVGNASLIYDGPTESAYFRGGTVNPFDGTPLAPLSPTSVDLDGAIKPGGAFYLDVKGAYKPFGLNATGEIEIRNTWPTAIHGLGSTTLGGERSMITRVSSIKADVTVSALGVNAELHGQVWRNGDFVLYGSNSVSFGDLTGSASFEMKNTHAAGFRFTSHMDATYTVAHTVRANMTVDFTFGVHNGHVTYSGYGSTSVEVWVPKDGWQVWDWHWESIGSVGVGVNNDRIWFNANGTRYDIYLP